MGSQDGVKKEYLPYEFHGGRTALPWQGDGLDFVEWIGVDVVGGEQIVSEFEHRRAFAVI